MRRKQCLKELTIKDNFMFGAVREKKPLLSEPDGYGTAAEIHPQN